MHVTTARSFRCHYSRRVPGHLPVALFVQLRAASAEDAAARAEAITGCPAYRVEPAPSTNTVSPVRSTLEV